MPVHPQTLGLIWGCQITLLRLLLNHVRLVAVMLTPEQQMPLIVTENTLVKFFLMLCNKESNITENFG